LPGWNVWDPFVSHWYAYYGTTFFRPRPADRQSYSVDAAAAHTEAYLRRLAARPGPFFLWASHVAPHARLLAPDAWGPPLAAARDAHSLRHVAAPSLRSRAFDVPGEGSPGLVGEAGLFSRSYVQHYYVQRLRSLQSVDRAVAGAIRVLRQTGELDHTYVFFTSDNGYLLAQHGLIGKNVLYGEDLGIPLVVRGPTVRTQSLPLPVSLVDLVPTFLDIASAGHPRPTDGVSFLPSLRGHRVRWRDTQLVQTGRMSVVDDASHGWTYRGVRTQRYTFGVDALTGQRLLYDRRRDPAELRNRATDPAYRAVVRELERRTGLLTDCAGRDCNRRFGRAPKPVPPRPH
jgi:arylsulfatase A-like enzyme